MQTVMFAQVDQVRYVLLETGTAETYGGFQELGPNAGVPANGRRHFIHIRSGGFAEG